VPGTEEKGFGKYVNTVAVMLGGLADQKEKGYRYFTSPFLC